MSDKRLPGTVAEAKELLRLYEKIKEAGEDYVNLPAAQEEKLDDLALLITQGVDSYDLLIKKQKEFYKERADLFGKSSRQAKAAKKELENLEAIQKQLQKSGTLSRKTLTDHLESLGKAGKTGTEEYKKLKAALDETSGSAVVAGAKASDVALAMLGTGKTGIAALKTSWMTYMKTMDDGLVEYTAKTGLFTEALKKAQISAIGPYRDMKGELVAVPGLLRNIGLSGKDAGEAFQGMTSHISIMRMRLHDMNFREEVSRVSNMMMAMKKLGVSFEVSGKNIDIFTRGLKQTPTMALESMKRLDGLADSLKINVNQAIQDFNTLAPTLLAFGDRSIEVFAGMQAQAQATGIAIGDLDKLAAKFDTFEGAASAAGRLNAILGGTHLSVMDLVHADPADKFEMIKDAVASAGVAFEDMDRRQKAVIANALNMNIEQASRMFGSQEDFRMAGEEMDTNATAAEELEARINQAMDSTALLKKSWSELSEPIRDYTEALRRVTNTIGRIPTQTMKNLVEALMGPSPEDAEARRRAHEGAIATSQVLLNLGEGFLTLGRRIPGLGTFTDFGLLGVILGKDPEATKKIIKDAAEDATKVKETIEGAMFTGPADPENMLAKFKPIRDGLSDIAQVAQGLSNTQPFSFLDSLDDTATRNMRNVLRQSSAFLRSIERAPAANLEQAKELFKEMAEIPLNVNLLAQGGAPGSPISPGQLVQPQEAAAATPSGPIEITLRTENRILAKAVLEGMGPEIRAKFAGA